MFTQIRGAIADLALRKTNLASGRSEGVDTTPKPDSAILKVAIVVGHAATMDLCNNAGAGLAANIVAFFARAGTDVTLLECAPVSSSQAAKRARTWASRGVGYRNLTQIYSAPAERDDLWSYFAYQDLKYYDFNIVVFAANSGVGYYSALAKREGLAFAETTIVVLGTELAQLTARNYLASKPADISRAFLEQNAVEYADVYWAATQSLVDLAKAAGWRLPATVQVTPELPLAPASPAPTAPAPVFGPERYVLCYIADRHSIDDFLEFLEAAEAVLEAQKERLALGEIQIRVLLCGVPETEVQYAALARFGEQAYRHSVEWSVLHELYRADVEHYARDGVVSTVIGGNGSVYGAVRLAQLGSRVIVRDAERLNQAYDLPARFVTKPAGAGKLSAAMAQVLFGSDADRKAVLKTRAALNARYYEFEASSAALCDLLRAARRSGQKDIGRPNLSKGRLKVSVCMPTYNRTKELREAVESLSRQSYDGFELILIDDQSTSEEALQTQMDLVKSLPFPVRRLQQANSGPAVARNYAATVAEGAYLLFMDDDNVALQNAVETFVRAAESSGADFLTCVAGIHPASEWGIVGGIPVEFAREADSNCKFWGPPIGPSVSLGLYYNCFGDCNALARKTTFQSLGGFKGFMYEDLELFMRAAVSGANVMVVPEILYLYRFHQASRSRTDRLLDGCIESMQSVLENTPHSLHGLIQIARSHMLGDVMRERLGVLSQGLVQPEKFDGKLPEYLWSLGANAQANVIERAIKGTQS